MAIAIRAKRLCSGVYEYSARRGKDRLTVSVEDREPNPAYGDTHRMWIAVADWNDAYSDPMDTKRDAVNTARHWLEEACRHA